MHSCPQQFHIFFLRIPQRTARSSHLHFRVVFNQRIARTKLIFHQLIFFVFLCFRDRIGCTSIFANVVIRMITKLSKRQFDKIVHITFFLPTDRCESRGGYFSFRFGWGWIFDGMLYGLTIVVESLVTEFTVAREISSSWGF